MTAGNGHDTGPGRPVMHGTRGLKHAVNTLGNRAIDRRTSMGRALAAWRSELVADLGGIEAVSTQELALVEEAVKTKLILDSIDAWLLSQPTLVNKRSRSVLPAVRDRQALVSTLRGLLSDLGLKRRSKAMPSLGEYLTQRSNGTGSNANRPQTDERDTGRTKASLLAGRRLKLHDGAPPRPRQRHETGHQAHAERARGPITAGQVDQTWARQRPAKGSDRLHGDSRLAASRLVVWPAPAGVRPEDPMLSKRPHAIELTPCYRGNPMQPR